MQWQMQRRQTDLEATLLFNWGALWRKGSVRYVVWIGNGPLVPYHLSQFDNAGFHLRSAGIRAKVVPISYNLLDKVVLNNFDRAVTRQIVQHTKKKRIITKARNTENTKGKSLDGLMHIERWMGKNEETDLWPGRKAANYCRRRDISILQPSTWIVTIDEVLDSVPWRKSINSRKFPRSESRLNSKGKSLIRVTCAICLLYNRFSQQVAV
jgi:hypothetical protein